MRSAWHWAVVNQRRAAEFGIDTRAGTPAEADAKMRGDIAKWGKVIADAKIPRQ